MSKSDKQKDPFFKIQKQPDIIYLSKKSALNLLLLNIIRFLDTQIKK